MCSKARVDCRARKTARFHASAAKAPKSRGSGRWRTLTISHTCYVAAVVASGSFRASSADYCRRHSKKKVQNERIPAVNRAKCATMRAEADDAKNFMYRIGGRKCSRGSHRAQYFLGAWRLRHAPAHDGAMV